MFHTLLYTLPGSLENLLSAITFENTFLMFLIYSSLLLWLMLTLPRP